MMIDFDYNATTPLKEPVRRAMEPYLDDKYGNPSSVHQVGQATKAAVEDARETIAEEMETNPETLTITASGSEANTLAIRGLVRPPYDERTVVTTPVEHSSVKDTVEWLETQGTTVYRAPVDDRGQLDVGWFKDRVTDDVDLVTVMSVNNETGVVFPVEEIAELCQQRDVIMHTDWVQALGKIEGTYGSIPVDLMSISAHKIGGPKGAGALIAPRSIELEPLIFGGHQERDRRGGTENVPALVGFAEAIDRVDPERFRQIAAVRDELEEQLRDRIDDLHVIAKETSRVANTSGMLINGVEGEDVVLRLDMAGIAVATGSACTSGSTQPSHVIRAMERPEGYDAGSFVRVSLPPVARKQNVEVLVDTMAETVRELRKESFV